LITDTSLGSFPNTGIYITMGKTGISCQASSSGTPSKLIGPDSLGTTVGACGQTLIVIIKNNNVSNLPGRTIYDLAIILNGSPLKLHNKDTQIKFNDKFLPLTFYLPHQEAQNSGFKFCVRRIAYWKINEI
jgi:hypothetical protein